MAQDAADMPADPRFPPKTPLVVEVLAFPQAQLLDVAGPLQVFASANDLAAARGEAPPYAPRVVAEDAGGVTTSSGLSLLAGPLPGEDEPVDTLVVAGGWGVQAAMRDEALLAWVRARAARARRLASVCSGAFLLAAAGLLDGRRVATHWSRCAELGRRFPALRVEPDPIFLRDGMVWTSAGITAGIDLSLALVEEDLGRPAALGVARQLVVFLKRPGGQAQFSAALSLQDTGDRFADLQGWMAGNLTGDLSLPALAARAGMSERSFLRHYRARTGLTPARAVETLRLEAARQMLTGTGRPLKRIAARCGFGSEETMRRVFLRHLAITPGEYRERFAG